MHNKALQTAFTSLTLGLVVFLSLWVIHASHQEMLSGANVPLQVKSGEDQPRSEKKADPFADPKIELSLDDKAVADSESIAGESLPRISPRTAPAVPTKMVAESQPKVAPSVPEPEPLDLPELDPAPKPFPEIESSGTEANSPAWLSAQATLEEQIKTLKEQQDKLESQLEKSNDALTEANARNKELSTELDRSHSEVDKLKKSTGELRSEADEMRSTLSEVTEEMLRLRKNLESLSRKPEEPKRIAALPNKISLSEPVPAPEPDSAEKKVLEEIYDSKNSPSSEDEKFLPPSPVAGSETIVTAEEWPVYGEVYEHSSPAPRQRRGLLNKLFNRGGRDDTEGCCTDTCTETCTETILDCEPLEDCEEKRGLIHQLGGLFSKSKDCEDPCGSCIETAAPCEGEYCEEKTGLIYDIKDWWSARKSSRKSGPCDCPVCSQRQYTDRMVSHPEVIYGMPPNARILPARTVPAQGSSAASVPPPAPGVQ